MLVDFAKENNMLVFGGSNFNGKEQYNSRGIANIDEDEKEI